MPTFKIRLLVYVLATMLVPVAQFPVLATAESETGFQARQAALLFNEGKLQQAVDLAHDAVRQNPRDWLSHAVMAFLYWQQGDAPDAMIEGQKAVRDAPGSETALINLAHMYQALESYERAIDLYDKTRKISPDNWVPWLGLARCFIKSGQKDRGLEILQEMNARERDSYDWYYQLGGIYLTIDKPDFAVAPLTRAVAVSKTAEQKAACTLQLYLALLRANQVERAGAMKDDVISRYHPGESESYVRTAFLLLRAQEPASGKELMRAAVSNLKEPADSDGFFRLGKVFQDKANLVCSDTQSGGWLQNAEESFRQAIELNPLQPGYHLALAGVLSREGRMQDVKEELAQACVQDQFDPLSQYLTATVTAPVASSKEINRSGTVQPTSRPGASQVRRSIHSGACHLTAVNFEVEGLTCACLVSRIYTTMSRIPGVAFVSLSRIKPYQGILLVDQSSLAAKDVFSLCSQNAFGTDATLKTAISFKVNAKQAVNSVEQAVRIAQDAKFGCVLKFERQFAPMVPVLPTTLVADRARPAI